MDASDVGREGLRLGSQLVGAAVAVPMTAFYFALGATVLVGRWLLDLTRQTGERLPWLASEQRDPERRAKAG